MISALEPTCTSLNLNSGYLKFRTFVLSWRRTWKDAGGKCLNKSSTIGLFRETRPSCQSTEYLMRQTDYPLSSDIQTSNVIRTLSHHFMWNLGFRFKCLLVVWNVGSWGWGSSTSNVVCRIGNIRRMESGAVVFNWNDCLVNSELDSCRISSNSLWRGVEENRAVRDPL